MPYTRIKSGTYTRNTVKVKHVKPKVYINKKDKNNNNEIKKP